MTGLGKLSPPKGAVKREKRVGHGESSGHGKTSGRGTKGQKSRSGYRTRPDFEGGQTPLIRRIPKRGFNHVPRVKVEIVNLSELNRFASGSVVDPAVLTQAGLIGAHRGIVKILGEGALAHPLTVKAHRFSASALAKIAAAGGTAEPIGPDA